MIWLAAGLVVMSIAFQLSPVALFLGFAAFHCVFGYIGAFVSEEHIFSVFSHHQAWFAQAAFVVALGLFSLLIPTDFACVHESQCCSEWL
jgi:hypothetical protein